MPRSSRAANPISETIRRPIAAEPLAQPDATGRKSGIDVLGDIAWGSHVCIFYETKGDLIDIGCAFLEAGLAANEFCFWQVGDPVSIEEATASLRARVPNFDSYAAKGQIEIISGNEVLFRDGQIDPHRAVLIWKDRLQTALANGFAGMRFNGDVFLVGSRFWSDLLHTELELDKLISGHKMVGLCAYPLTKSGATDILDAARVHQFSVARRNGQWEFLETPELKRAKQEIRKLSGALDILSRPFPGHDLLTPRERVALAQIARGASSKEAARTLGISPRTMEFHRANILQKLGAKNSVDLVRRVLGS
jgi:DNA-binding CsgD family transcriptional regulator